LATRAEGKRMGDGKRCFRGEHMMERDGMFNAYDIDQTPTAHYTPTVPTSIARDVRTIYLG